MADPIGFLAEPRLAVAAAAGLIGLGFGALAERSRFCLVGGFKEATEQGDGARLAAFFVAAFTALAATQAAVATGYADVAGSVYLATPAGLPGIVLGGLLFGYGATLTRGCAGRLTILAGTGNLRAAIVILVVAIVAYATIRGALAPPRLWIESAARPAAALPDLASLVGLGDSGRAMLAAFALLAAAALAPRAGLGRAAAAFGIGLLVAAGWVASTQLGDDGFEKLQPWSIAFVAPLANGLQYAMTYTGAKVDFGIAFAGGALAGAFSSAAAGRRLALQSFATPRQTLRYLGGALLMGFGGVLALGCTTGEGLSGLSTLSPLSVAAILSIVAGVAAGQALDRRAAHALPAPA